jgi:hypothetical protein
MVSGLWLRGDDDGDDEDNHDGNDGGGKMTMSIQPVAACWLRNGLNQKRLNADCPAPT